MSDPDEHFAARDRHLLELSAEVLNVYWSQPSAPEQVATGPLTLRLPVLDGDVEVLINVTGGVFSVQSKLILTGDVSPTQLSQMNAEMPAASYHYVLRPDADGSCAIWLQTKLAVPDLDWESVRPPALTLAFNAGYRTGQGIPQSALSSWTGPNSYDHFVYLADFLGKAVHEQWLAQQEAASIQASDTDSAA